MEEEERDNKIWRRWHAGLPWQSLGVTKPNFQLCARYCWTFSDSFLIDHRTKTKRGLSAPRSWVWVSLPPSCKDKEVQRSNGVRFSPNQIQRYKVTAKRTAPRVQPFRGRSCLLLMSSLMRCLWDSVTSSGKSLMRADSTSHGLINWLNEVMDVKQ